jgi:hypothetical protein
MLPHKKTRVGFCNKRKLKSDFKPPTRNIKEWLQQVKKNNYGIIQKPFCFSKKNVSLHQGLSSAIKYKRLFNS